MLAELARGVATALALTLIIAALSKASGLRYFRIALLDLAPRLRKSTSRRVGVIAGAIIAWELALGVALLAAPSARSVGMLTALTGASSVLATTTAWRRAVAGACFGGAGRHSRPAVIKALTFFASALTLMPLSTATNRTASLAPNAFVVVLAGISMVTASRVVSGWPPRLHHRSHLRSRGRSVRLLKIVSCEQLDPKAMAFADLAWWAATVEVAPASRSVMRTVAVPGARGMINATIPNRGAMTLVLLTPGGPVTGVSARLQLPDDQRTSWWRA